MLLYYADIRIELGDGSKLEEQLVDLGQMLDGLEGKKGTLDLKDFDPASKRASFKLDTASDVKNEDSEKKDDENSTKENEQMPVTEE